MRPLYLALAVLVSLFFSPAVFTASPAPRSAPAETPALSETHDTLVIPGYDPIAPAGWDGALIAREFTLEESAVQADVIVVGRIASQTSRTQATTINTDVTVNVERALKGTAGATLTFVNPGGTVGARHIAVGGEPQFVSGERVLLFLKSITPGQPLYLLQLSHSKFTLTGTDAVQLEGKRIDSQPISSVESRLKTVLGPNVVIGASGNQRGSTDFTIQQPPNCAPWTAADFPIQHRINEADAPPSITPGFSYYDIIYRSLLMWQQLPDSYVSFGILGSGTETAPTQNGVNSVFWSNIDLIIPGGVIGLNYCYHDGTRRFESDTILTNSANYSWDQNPDDGINGNALSVRSVAGHEFGHGIQLDHSSDANALMFASIPIGGNKVLNADDQAGAAAVHPLSGAGAPGAPTGLSVSQLSPTSNVVNWTAGAGTKIAYEIERATASCTAPFRSVNTVAGTTTRYVDNNYGFGLPANTVYCYRVKTLGQGGDSGYSNAASLAPTCPPTAISLWPNSTTPQTPAVADGGSYELGVKFRSDVSGSVCGVKFYKGTGNGGTHTGTLWTTSGTPLATGTFFNETSTGWQTMAFSTPVPITANTNYIVSYSDPQGHLAVNTNYFTAQYDNGVLHAPSNAASGGNAVFGFSAGSFPSSSSGGSNYWVDPLFIPDATPSSCTGTTRTLFAQQSVPGTPFLNDPSPYTFGMKFTAEVPGIVCGVRFYKGAGNNGAHTGQLWTLQGALLASVAFTNESASGWQQANFSNPVQISAGTTYAIAYSTSSGLAFNQGQFSQNGVDNAPLHSPSSPSSGGNGLYAFGLNTFPVNSANGTNYWVDVVFQANAGLCGTSTVTVFSPASVPAVPAVGDAGSYELGAKFMSDVGGQVCGVRFYKGTGNAGTHVGRLWNLNGTQLASGTFVSETATGWQQVMFPTPVQITANTMYIISYSDPQGRLSVNSGQLNTSIDNSPLHLPASGSVGGNGLYAVGAGNFPGNASPGSDNYWVDLVFAPGSSGGGVSDSCIAGSSSVLLSTSTPVTPSVNDGASYEFGMKFRSDVNGVACGVRFYKGAGNVGTHIGRLWTINGVLLSTVTFTGETASGWQQAMFASPVALTANAGYVISYTTPQGHPSFDANAFNNSIDNGILHAPSSAQAAGNGLYGTPGAFPQGATSGNFWIDVLFAPTCPCSIFSNNYVPTNPAIADGTTYELGVRFKPEQNGFITGVRFYKGNGNGGTHTGRLWRADGALLASATFSNETPTGWQQVSFGTPVFVAAGGTYVVSYGDPQGHPAADINYYTRDVESGPLTAFANSAGGNAVYTVPAGSFPAFSANGNNFWVDPVWVAGCLNCLVVASPPALATAQPQSGPPPPPPGSNQAIPPAAAPPGSQQIRPPSGEQVPPVPSIQPGPTSTRPATDGPVYNSQR